MVQYTTLFVAAAVLFAAVPALADSTTAPHLNRRSPRELYRRAPPKTVWTNAAPRLPPPQAPWQRQREQKERAHEQAMEDYIADQNLIKSHTVPDYPRPKPRRRDLEVEVELLARMLERDFYDDLD